VKLKIYLFPKFAKEIGDSPLLHFQWYLYLDNVPLAFNMALFSGAVASLSALQLLVQSESPPASPAFLLHRVF
jgi:hypothetical protein